MVQLFLTDYGSYNNGTQFEFGHWVDLEQFGYEEEFQEYIANHFNDADEKSPLPCGTPREEIMFTDYEGIPNELYCESGSTISDIFKWIELPEHDKIAVGILLWNGYDMEEALEKYEDVIYYDSESEAEDSLDEIYPELYELTSNPWVSINYASYVKDCFTVVNVEGSDYWVQDDTF